jgi:carboxylesterase
VDLRQRQARGVRTLPGVGNDVADRGAKELAYDAAPVEAMLSLLDAVEELHPRLGEIACPTLVMTSPQDHVVPASQSDLIAATVSGPVERMTLARSYHVATLDYDKGEIERRAVEFARKVTGLESAGRIR